MASRGRRQLWTFSGSGLELKMDPCAWKRWRSWTRVRPKLDPGRQHSSSKFLKDGGRCRIRTYDFHRVKASVLTPSHPPSLPWPRLGENQVGLQPRWHPCETSCYQSKPTKTCG